MTLLAFEEGGYQGTLFYAGIQASQSGWICLWCLSSDSPWETHRC